MRLQTLKAWAKTVFEVDSIPHRNTLLNMARNGQIEGAVKMGARWYIDLDAKTQQVEDLLTFLEN